MESIARYLMFGGIILFLIGGGISGAFDYIVPEMKRKINEHLPSYYTKDLYVGRAYLKNDAGILGAAGLIIEGLK